MVIGETLHIIIDIVAAMVLKAGGRQQTLTAEAGREERLCDQAAEAHHHHT